MEEKTNHSKKLIFMAVAILVVLLGAGLATALVEGSVTSIAVSPDPVKLGSSTYLQVGLSESSYVTAKVYKETGVLVRVLTNSTLLNSGTNYLKWDGKDSNGQFVSDGYYKFYVEAKNSAGEITGQGDKLQLCAHEPRISNVSHSPSQINPANGETLTINYTLSNEAKVTIKILKGSYPVRTIMADTLVAAGAQTVTWDGKLDDGTLAGDGSYTYQIDAVSPYVSHFRNSYKSSTLFDVEKEAPKITEYMVYPDPLEIGAKTLSIRYHLSEDAKVTLKVLDKSGNVVKTLLSGTARLAGYRSESWDGKIDSTTYISEGNYTVVISAVDKYNKTSGEQTAPLTAANKPKITNAYADPSIFDPSADTINSTSIRYDLSHNALVTVKILNGSYPVRTIVTKQSQQAGANSVVWDGKDDSGVVVGDGSYSFEIWAESALVYYYYTTVKGTVTVEKGAPKITDFYAGPNPFKLGTTSPLDIRYSLSEDCTVSIDVYKGDTLRNLVVNQAQLAGYRSATWDGKDNAGNLVGEGIYTVVVKAVDASGLYTQASGTFTAAYQPSITNVSNTPEPFNPANGSATISFNLSNDADVTVSIWKGGKYPVRNISLGKLNTGANTVLWDGKDDNGVLVSDGSHTYQIEAKSPTVDHFRSTYKGTLTLESRSPAINDLYMSPYTVKIGETASIKYSVSEPASVSFTVYDTAGAKVREFPVQTVPMDGYYSLSWDTKDNGGALIKTGEYVLKAFATDQAGKTAAKELAFKAGKVPQISNVSATPAILNTGQGEKTSTIAYTVYDESHITVKVFDANNQLFRTLRASDIVIGSDSVVLDVYKDGVAVQGTLTYTIDAASVIGYFKAAQVKGTIQVDEATATPPPSGSGCMSCHTNYPTPHPVTNCAGCHGNDEPILDCAQCHPGWTHDSSVLTKFECEYCHNATYSYKVPGHGDITTLHTAPLAADCQKCHLAPLDTEHPRHTDDVTGYPYDCNTCHKSTVTNVVYAINNKLKNCDACHGQADHEAQHTPTGIQADCTKCHIDSLTKEHLNNPTTQTDSATGQLNPWSCDTCHSSTAAQNVQDAVYYNQRNCDACHASADHQTVHNTTALDVNCTTASGCHNNNLTEEHLNNTVTQTDPATGQLKGWTCDTCHASSKPTVTAAVYAGNENCMACHSSGHNVNFAAPIPPDIPKYPGFIWTAPQEASLWAGESWMPADYTTGGKVVISNRRPATNGVVDSVYGAVGDYYMAEMQANGWTQVSPLSTRTDYFSLDFTKGSRMARVWFYGGADHSADSTALGTGYRIELIYK